MNAHRPADANPSPADPPRRELAGVVERITYQNPDTGYIVARLLAERGDGATGREDDRLVTVVGTLPALQPGEAITASGWWRNDPRHGWQFHATTPARLCRPPYRACAATSARGWSRGSVR